MSEKPSESVAKESVEDKKDKRIVKFIKYVNSKYNLLLKKVPSKWRERSLLVKNSFLNYWICIPGMMIMLGAPVVLVAPALLKYVIALVVFSCGAVMTGLAFKFIEAKKHLDGLLGSVKGAIVVQAMQVGEGEAQDVAQQLVADDSKKIIVH